MTPERPVPLELSAIVEAGLCIGCGLCRSVAGDDRGGIVMTPEGRERPVAIQPLDESTLLRINEVGPGTEIGGADGGRLAGRTPIDPIRRPAARVLLGHAGDPNVRYRAASGRVLTALGQYLLNRGDAEAVLHVAASRERRLRSQRRLSSTRPRSSTRPARGTAPQHCSSSSASCSTRSGRSRSSASRAT